MVVAIIAVLTAMVVPNIGGSRGRDVSDAAHGMVLLINQARQEASLTSRVWRVVLDPEEGQMRFQQRSGGDFAGVERSPFRRPRSYPGVRWGALTVNGDRARGVAEVYLYPTGEQDTFRLTLRAGDFDRTVVMDPVGRARVEEGDNG